MVKHLGLAIIGNCRHPSSVGSAGSPVRTLTTEKLSQSQNCSNQVGREQGNRYSGLSIPTVPLVALVRSQRARELRWCPKESACCDPEQGRGERRTWEAKRGCPAQEL